MSSKSLYLKYIIINEEVYPEDISEFIESVGLISVDDAKILYYYIKKDFPIDKSSLGKGELYRVSQGDLFHLDDREGIEIKKYVVSLCMESVTKIIYPIVGCSHLKDLNIEGCFIENINDKTIIGTTGPKISFGTANFINRYHMLFFLLKKYKFPKIS